MSNLIDNKDLEKFVEEHIPEFKRIRYSNELGDCMESMNDVYNLLRDNGFAARKVSIYCCNEDKGFIEDYYNNVGLKEFSVYERGSIYYGYVTHFVCQIDGYIIDINASSEINDCDDVLMPEDIYKSNLRTLNSNKYGINADNIRFVMR